MAGWVALDAEALEDLENGLLIPLATRETGRGTEAWMPHTFSAGPGSDKRCWHCGLLPLDYDRIEWDCVVGD